MTETDLVARAQAGELPAFEALVKHYQRQVYAYACRLVLDREEARDLAQQTFLQAYRSLAGFRGASGFGTWLYKIAAHLCFDHLKARRRLGDPVEVDDLCLAGNSTPEDDLLAREGRQRLEAALARLSPKQRAVVTLRLEQELTYEEISQVLGGSSGAARVNYSQALKALKKILLAEKNHDVAMR